MQQDATLKGKNYVPRVMIMNPANGYNSESFATNPGPHHPSSKN
jgi:hypothetical protein